MAEPVAYEALRRRGVQRAQEASGGVWTDYNVHDPGVTLLELFCFALTELDYRARFPVADLLTDAEGELDLEAQALAPPRAALPARPVTLDDWERLLSNASPAVGRAYVHPARATDDKRLHGLYDIFVAPAGSEPEDAAQALADVEAAFLANRNLCEDLARIAVAEPVNVELRADVRLHGRNASEEVAARIYDVCDQLLQGGAAWAMHRPATRRDVAEAPERYFGPAPGGRRKQVSTVELFDAISDIDQVVGVMSLVLDPPLSAPLATGQYRRIRIPDGDADGGLRMTVGDRAAPFDLREMRAILARLRAERRLTRSKTLDDADWNAAPKGRRRDFGHQPLGFGLPRVYLADDGPLGVSARMRDRGAAAQMRGFLAHFDGLLASMDADLANMHELYSGRRPDGRTYFPGKLDVAGVRRAASDAPKFELADLSNAVARQDPRHDRKGRALDYLLALYAEAFSQNSLRRHDLYRSSAERRDAILENRARLLRHVAEFSRGRFGGGEGCGLRRKLEVLLDFPDQGGASPAEAFEALRETLREHAGPRRRRSPPSLPSAELPLSEDPLDMLVPRREAPPIAPRDLVRETAFLRCEAPSDAAIRAGARQDSWLLAPAPSDRWRLFFAPEEGGVAYLCGTFATRDAAILRGNQLRAWFGEANRRSEAVYIVEDILLRRSDDDRDAAPMFLWVVFAGWTDRTADADFRRLAEETVVGLCPAHIVHRTRWLNRPDMVAFEKRLAACESAADDKADTGARSAGPMLRAFLASREEEA